MPVPRPRPGAARPAHSPLKGRRQAGAKAALRPAPLLLSDSSTRLLYCAHTHTHTHTHSLALPVCDRRALPTLYV